MPELPEVECWGRRVAEKYCLGRTIQSAYAKPDERIVIDGVTPRKLVSSLKGRKIEGCHRRGKQMWWTLSGGGPSPLWHFGMTGGFCSYAHKQERPKFLKVELQLDDGQRFGFVDPRRFGRVRLAEDPLNEPPLSELGPDAWLELPGHAWWTEQLARRKPPIKALLLNQSFLAGVGNWIADEVCYQSNIAPQRRANDLSPAEIKKLRGKLRHVLQKACDWEADYRKFPRTWLFHHRWGKNEEALTGRGEEIEFDTVGGRTTAWVPKVQL
ncbi:MAG: DNA-formamidopyrimidine glycosylase family protein [Planctomycetota bacterium]